MFSQYLRTIYEKEYEKLSSTSNKKMSPETIYNLITSKKEKQEKGSPHSNLLEADNFTYFQKPSEPQKMWDPSQYAYVRGVVLKSRKMWEVYEEFLDRFLHAKIPNSLVKKMSTELNAIGKDMQTKQIRAVVLRKLTACKA